MKNLLVRTLSGVIYVALIVCSIMFGGWWAFPLLCCVFAFLGIIEFQRMSLPEFFKTPLTVLVDLVTGMLILMVLFVPDPLIISLIVFAVIALILIRFVMQLYLKESDPVRHIAISITSWFYIVLPLFVASLFLHIPMGQPLLLLMFVMIWLNDTGAFLVGSAIGSHRLFQRLSPKKSWEGFFGGLIFCMVAGYLTPSLFPQYLGVFSPIQLASMGLVVSVFATWGDLFESMIKRNSGVKDSGNIIPGHGGILDRIDSLLFVAPIVLLFIVFLSLNTSFQIISDI